MTTEDIGLDLDRDFPTCAACRKKSDGAKRVMPMLREEGWLCGTHYDEWLRSPEFCESPPDRPNASRLARFAAFVERLRRERYRACWEAVPT